MRQMHQVSMMLEIPDDVPYHPEALVGEYALSLKQVAHATRRPRPLRGVFRLVFPKPERQG
jgi:hypothetical protein